MEQQVPLVSVRVLAPELRPDSRPQRQEILLSPTGGGRHCLVSCLGDGAVSFDQILRTSSRRGGGILTGELLDLLTDGLNGALHSPGAPSALVLERLDRLEKVCDVLHDSLQQLSDDRPTPTRPPSLTLE